MVDGFSAINEKNVLDKPASLGFWLFHQALEGQHAAHTMDELEEAIEGKRIPDQEKFLKAADEILDAVRPSAAVTPLFTPFSSPPPFIHTFSSHILLFTPSLHRWVSSGTGCTTRASRSAPGCSRANCSARPPPAVTAGSRAATIVVQRRPC